MKGEKAQHGAASEYYTVVVDKFVKKRGRTVLCRHRDGTGLRTIPHHYSIALLRGVRGEFSFVLGDVTDATLYHISLLFLERDRILDSGRKTEMRSGSCYALNDPAAPKASGVTDGSAPRVIGK